MLTNNHYDVNTKISSYDAKIRQLPCQFCNSTMYRKGTVHSARSMIVQTEQTWYGIQFNLQALDIDRAIFKFYNTRLMVNVQKLLT